MPWLPQAARQSQLHLHAEAACRHEVSLVAERPARRHGRLAGPVAVGLGDDLEQVAAQILEVDAAAAEMVVDLAFLLLSGIGPVLELARLDAAEDLIELLLAHE